LGDRDDRLRVVEEDLPPRLELVGGDLRGRGHPQLAAGVEDLDGAVVVTLEHLGVGQRRAAHLVQVAAQREDLLTGLLEGARELLVLGLQALHTGLQVQDLLLQVAGPRGPRNGRPLLGAGAARLVGSLAHGRLLYADASNVTRNEAWWGQVPRLPYVSSSPSCRCRSRRTRRTRLSETVRSPRSSAAHSWSCGGT